MNLPHCQIVMKDSLIRTAKYIYYYLPEGLKSKITKKKQERDLQAALERAKRVKVSKEEVEKIIQSLDIGDCDVILHSSTMNIGKIQGGVKWITKCLFEKVGLSEHALLVSALPYRGRFKDYLEKGVEFDVRTAPIAMGGINEYIGSLSEAHRSIHPTHSIVAVGKGAEEYVGNHHLDKTPFGPNSPYYKIIKNRGKAVMFGASLDNFTCVHVIEDMLGDLHPVKVYAPKRYKVKCVDSMGNELSVETPSHDALKGTIRQMMPLKPKLLKRGIMKTWPIGDSDIEVIDLYEFAIFYLEEIKNGNTIYGKSKVSPQLKEKIEELEKTL